MKKLFVAVMALLAVSLAGYHMADARPWGGGGMMGQGCGACNNAGWFADADDDGQVDEATVKAREAFLAQTTELRKKLTMKEAEMGALMSRDNPDEKKAGQLAGEIFDLRTQVRQKAIDAGLKPGSGGCRMGKGMGGMGMGQGRHPGGMMMGPMGGGQAPADSK